MVMGINREERGPLLVDLGELSHSTEIKFYGHHGVDAQPQSRPFGDILVSNYGMFR